MKTKKARIVNYFELSEKWQKEAKRNLDEYAEDTLYFEPAENSDPKKHVLWDLNEVFSNKGCHKGFKYNATMPISNNSGMLLNFSDDMETVEYIFI